MHPELQQILMTHRDRKGFQAVTWVSRACTKLNEYMSRAGLKACVVNLSGGIDSAVTFALASRAANAPESPIRRVIGILQPIHSTSEIQYRAYSLSKFGELIRVDQSEIFDSLVRVVSQAFQGKAEPSAFAKGNLKSYMRTPVAFYVAQLLAQEGDPAVVIGTGNYDEDGFLFYFSKAGDGVSDVQLIHDLHKSEVFEVGKFLGIPDSILNAPPSADLWEGQTDEGEIGVSYDFVELYVCAKDDQELKDSIAGCSRDARDQFERVGTLLERIHTRNKHKAHFPLNI
ncbi:NH3-dependent NAD synthetase [Giardia muris]|uniref:NH3-dependent NAD synthetase n=1 Tax=Giardia muris TaxID=5742 RepID=A0A4Z1SXA1_GIAMU|nr:NH3-dependent NAD synthetase [Giardia muris]|eukprot:TNJ29455.1 NH3-dependent NAD synthetase [Giardia muris]